MKASATATNNLTDKIQFQRLAVRSLKEEIFGTDKVPQSKYIQDFTAEYVEFEKVSTYDELLRVAHESRVIFVGDYHSLAKAQEFQARFLQDLQGERLILALEMFYGRNQIALDEWMAGTIDDPLFLRRVDFELEWGYSWKNYRKLLEVARSQEIPVFGVDIAPRHDLRYIRKRDSAVAAKIVDLVRKNPDHTVVVIFGEAHLATKHLPGKVAGHFSPDRMPAPLVVLQNVDELYWRAARRGMEGNRVVKVRERVYCVFSATPFEKYEGYRKQLEVWKAQDQDAQKLDLTSTIYNLIDVILEFTRIDKYKYCLRDDGVCVEFMIDGYPEVYSSNEFEDFQSVLENSQHSKRQIRQIVKHTRKMGSCYVPKINSIFIGEFNLVHGAEEAAHFVNFALKHQRYGEYRSIPLSRVEAFYLKSLEEALGYFGSKLIDPRRNHIKESFVLNPARARPALKRLLRLSPAQMLSMKRFVRAHKDMERRYEELAKIPKAVSDGVSSRGQMRDILTHELGYLLGEQLYRGYLQGRLTRREVAQLFHVRFEAEGSPLEAYLTLAETAGVLEDLT